MTVEKIKDTEQAWDDRKLGAQPEFVGVADDSHEKALQEALECEVLQRNAVRMSPQTGRKPA